MTRPLATVAFVPREQFSTTQRCLERLLRSTPAPYELVCIDGGSPPEVRDYLERMALERDFTLVRTSRYLTPNQARNLALPHVRTPYVVFVDNDVLVTENWLQPLVDCAEQTGAWVVGPLYFEFEPECQRIHMFGGECRIESREDGRRDYVERHHVAHQLLADVGQPLRRQETELIEFHTVLVAMEAFRQLGPLDEGLLCNAEHGDLCLMVRQAGHRVFLEPDSRITYAPPKSLHGADLEYFQLRWSDSWARATSDHLARKWNLATDAPGVRQSIKWVGGHRRYSLPWLNKLRRQIGNRWASKVERYLVAPWESAANRRQFPLSQWGSASQVSPKVVHSPVNQAPMRAA